MSYSNLSSIWGFVPEVTADDIQAWFESNAALGASFVKLAPIQPPANIGAAIHGLGQAWGVNQAVVAGLIAHESSYWQSAICRDKRNPSGLGAFNDTAYQSAITFPDAYNGILATYAHLWSYFSTVENDLTRYDPRRQAVIAKGWLGACKVLRDLEQKWAFSDPADYARAPESARYGAMVADKANRLTAFAQTHGGTVYDISGFVPPRIVQQWFPANGVSYLGEDMEMWGVCIHETGNTDPASEAQQNVDYMKSQECIRRQASWHATVGRDIIIETIPDAKQSYHASDGAGPGNAHFYAIEGVMCYKVGSPDFRRVMLNHAWYAAKKLRDKRLPLVLPADPDAPYDGKQTLAQHHAFARDRKDCPQLYRDNNLWGDFAGYMRAFYDAPAGRMRMPDLDPTPRDGFITPFIFGAFYDARGGIETFGLFTSGVIEEDNKLVQYAERARFEYAPDVPGGVQLGLVGNEAFDARYPGVRK